MRTEEKGKEHGTNEAKPDTTDRRVLSRKYDEKSGETLNTWNLAGGTS